MAGVGAPIIVYQMGKVGSSSVYEGLLNLHLDAPVHHCHFLNYLDEMEELIVRTRPSPRESLEQVAKARDLKQRLDANRNGTWNIISLVRTPVRRNVSAFFENLNEYFPGAEERFARDELTLDEIEETFLSQYDHDAPRYWFDSQVQPVFGIDVYAEAFPRERGYQVFEGAQARMLVLRMEDLERVASKAISEFLGVPQFRLSRANDAEEKSYGDIYHAFLSAVALPERYYAEMHSLKYSKHFYSEAELSERDVLSGGRPGRAR
jgi:Putative capsular polysaccharide synthesis protein